MVHTAIDPNMNYTCVFVGTVEFQYRSEHLRGIFQLVFVFVSLHVSYFRPKNVETSFVSFFHAIPCRVLLVNTHTQIRLILLRVCALHAYTYIGSNARGYLDSITYVPMRVSPIVHFFYSSSSSTKHTDHCNGSCNT